MEGSDGSVVTPWRLPDAPVFYRHPLHIYRIEAMAAKPDQDAGGVGGHGPMTWSPFCRGRCLRRFCGPSTILEAAAASRPMRRSPRPQAAPARPSPGHQGP